ncbi:MAG TPA: hypothetical protein VJR89_03085, partial [Polyangiales bacterium]|nr:hypothetical protein [Polyangiales bacterium]
FIRAGSLADAADEAETGRRSRTASVAGFIRAEGAAPAARKRTPSLAGFVRPSAPPAAPEREDTADSPPPAASSRPATKTRAQVLLELGAAFRDSALARIRTPAKLPRSSTILPPPGDRVDVRIAASPRLPELAAPSHEAAPSGDSGRGTLRPIEATLLSVASESRRMQLMAAALFGVFLFSALVLSFGPSRARERESEKARVAQPKLEAVKNTPSFVAAAPAAAPAAEPVQLAAAPAKPSRPAPPPAATPAPPPPAKPSASATRTSSLSIVAAPGRPKVRDPWQDPAPGELKRAHVLAQNGAPGDEARIKALREYNRDHPDDVRGYLVIGQLYLNRLWRTDCVEEWQKALERDPTARGAPEILPALLDMVEQGKAPLLAERLLLKAYGSEALEAVDRAFEDVKNPMAAARLHTLRLHITEPKSR